MTGDPKNLSCQQFQERLADLIGSGDAAGHPHLHTCENCQKLLSDLQTIAQAARELLPPEQPNEQLWDRIREAIEKEEDSAKVD